MFFRSFFRNSSRTRLGRLLRRGGSGGVESLGRRRARRGNLTMMTVKEISCESFFRSPQFQPQLEISFALILSGAGSAEMEGFRSASSAEATGTSASGPATSNPPDSKFASPDFAPVDFLNALFPNEQSLSGVDPLVEKLRLRVRRVDDEILTAVRGQTSGGAKALSSLEQAQSAIGSLEHRVSEIKSKASTSEKMVAEICADVKKLDFAKKHLTSTITSLRRLSMLVTAVEQLEKHTNNRQYKESANLLHAVNELSMNFENYSEIPKIAELKKRKDVVAQTLKNIVFEDFFMNWQPSVVESDENARHKLVDACFVLDALPPEHREALIGDLTNKELTGYASVFDAQVGAGGESKNLDQVDRRYAYIKRNLKQKENMYSVFPEGWRFPELLTMSLCKLTRANLLELLDQRSNESQIPSQDKESLKDSQTTSVIQAMHKTVAFERDLDTHFGLGGKNGGGHTRSQSNVSNDFDIDGTSVSGNENLSASEVRAKHATRIRNAQIENQKGGRALPMDSAATQLGADTFTFKDVITSCFEDHLGGYVDMEEKQLVEELGRLVGGERFGATEVVEGKTPEGKSLSATLKSSLNVSSGGSRNGSNANLQSDSSAGGINSALTHQSGIAAIAGTADGAGEVLQSAGAMFLNIKKVFKRCSNLTKGKPLLALHGAFSRVLRAYASALSDRAKDAGVYLKDLRIKSNVSTAQKTSNETLALCLIINTAEWCSETVGPLGESMKRTLISDGLKDLVGRDVEATEEVFNALAGDASSFLVTGVVQRTEIAKGITSTKWENLDTVGDQSKHVDTCASALQSATLTARKTLKKNTFQFFCEKLAGAVANDFYSSILKGKRISDTGAQQLLLDVQSVKKLLQELPLTGNKIFGPESQNQISKTHARLVDREIIKCEALCKVLMSPVETLRDTFQALLPDASISDFQTVCELKGMKKQDAAQASATLKAVRAAQGRGSQF